MKCKSHILFLIAAHLILPVAMHAQSTAFTYEGRLNDGTAPANGFYDLRFAVFDNVSAGNQQGPTLTNTATAVSNGIFLVTLDFGDVFPGPNRFLEIAVRTNGGGVFNTLAPRQQLLPTPYAIFANNSATFTGTFSGDVSGTQNATVISSASTSASANTIVKRDSFGGVAASNLTLNGNLLLPPGTTNSGLIYSGVSTLIANFGDGNFFAGLGAGNLGSSGAFGFGGNTALGDATLTSNTTGYFNTAAGYGALSNNINGAENTTIGAQAMQFSTLASQNTAVGFQALRTNASSQNTAVGFQALAASYNGGGNTAVGSLALANTTGGANDVAIGWEAMQFNTAGTQDVAVGVNALAHNSTGNNNTAVGAYALVANTSGGDNTAIGSAAMGSNTTGTHNTAIGDEVMAENTSGNFNTAHGDGALLDNSTGDRNTAIGYDALLHATGENNIGLGFQSGYNLTTSSNNIDIGNMGVAGETGIIRIGTAGQHTATYIAGTLNADGFGITNVNAAQFSGQFASHFWQLGGNTTTNAQSMGTFNDQPVQFIVNGTPALRLISTGLDSPNVIGGASANTINPLQIGSVIAGGGYGPGGPSNYISGNFAGIVGGNGNSIGSGADYSIIVGGEGNSVFQNHTFVGGGKNNMSPGSFCTIAGGDGNYTETQYSSIGGGQGNFSYGRYGSVAGGLQNTVFGESSTVGGGKANHASGDMSVVAGGDNNDAGFPNDFIGGGHLNRITGTTFSNNIATGSTISGGLLNTIYADLSGNIPLTVNGATIGGGASNAILSDYCTIGGGLNNYAGGGFLDLNNNPESSIYCTVGGGSFNSAAGIGATVAGGQSCRAHGTDSAIGGGGGNFASGIFATIPGGVNNTASGYASFAAGVNAVAQSDGTFCWADASNPGQNIYANRTNSWLVRASGGVYLYTSSNLVSGAVLEAGSGSWSSFSDRNAKENFHPVDTQSVLREVADMSLTTWNYKTQAKDIRHIGPMAQDFHAAFNVGENDTTISTVDEGGVALAAIQGLNQKLETELKEKDSEISDLRHRLETLEKLLLARNSK